MGDLYGINIRIKDFNYANRGMILEDDINKTISLFLNRTRNETAPDQWQTQILLRILKKATVIYISELSDDLVRKLHMIPAHSIDEAVCLAKNILKKENATITAIPDGISVMVRK